MIGYPTLLYLPTPPSIRIQTNNITNRRLQFHDWFSCLVWITWHLIIWDGWLVGLCIPCYIVEEQPPKIRLAKVHVDSDFTDPSSTSGSNLHCFRALTPCAILDVLGLPYSDSQGRHCAYYQDYSFSTFSGMINSGLCNPYSEHILIQIKR